MPSTTQLSRAPDDPALDVERLLEDAAEFERAGDETGALSRLRLAQRVAAGDQADDVALALERIRTRQRASRLEIARREAAFDRRERVETGLPPEVTPT